MLTETLPVTTIYLIRHGQAQSGWNIQYDPGLDDIGRRQAEQAARALAERGPLPIIASPMRRARESAAEFEMLWRRAATVDPRVTEIPSPPGVTLDERGEWLRALAKRAWSELDPAIQEWRRAAIDCLLAVAADTVVVSHFMVINAVVSGSSGDDRVVVCNPQPGSRTTLERSGAAFRVVEVGAQGASRVL